MPDRAAAQLLVARQDALLGAEAAREASGKKWDDTLRMALYEGVVALEPTALHAAAADYAIQGSGNDTTLATLNFDTLLEAAIRLGGTAAHSSVDDAPSPTGTSVHHLHGVVDRKTTERVVITLSDFNELLIAKSCWQRDLLETALHSGALLIVGTSYRDPDIRRWLHEAMANRVHPHKAVVLLAREGFGLTPHDFDNVKDALSAQWRSVGLEPLIVEDHSDAAQILRELRHLGSPGYRAPRERAHAIWAAHENDFTRLQAEYVEFLVEDSTRLRGVLGVSELNLTLWIADGQRRLGRWASHDRNQRSVDELRRIPTGHDSEWVAGRALGAESVLFQDLQSVATRRWSTVLAVPVRVALPDAPEFATAVLSVGLLGEATDYESLKTLWLDTILDMSNEWGARLGTAPPPVPRLH